MVRAKFKVESITSFPGQTAVKIAMRAICDDTTEENRRFSKYTPDGYARLLRRQSACGR